MATSLKNLSDFDKTKVPDATGMKIGIVVSEWNDEITKELYYGAVDCLVNHGVAEKDIIYRYVPGSFELPLGAQFLIEYSEVDAVICLGCIIQGETRHFEFISNAVSQGIMQVNLEYNIPVVFGVLTTDNMFQARERSGGQHGNKGIEAAITAIKMATFQKDLCEE